MTVASTVDKFASALATAQKDKPKGETKTGTIDNRLVKNEKKIVPEIKKAEPKKEIKVAQKDDKKLQVDRGEHCLQNNAYSLSSNNET